VTRLTKLKKESNVKNIENVNRIEIKRKTKEYKIKITQVIHMPKDVTGFAVLVIAGLIIIQSKVVLWEGITWGTAGLILIIIGLWGIFGNDITKAFQG